MIEGVCHPKELVMETSEFPYAGNKPVETRNSGTVTLEPLEGGKFGCWMMVNGLCGGYAKCEPQQTGVRPEQIVELVRG